jgi:hypothetical protein
MIAVISAILRFRATKSSFLAESFHGKSFDFYLHLEPLLNCMSAGFTVQISVKQALFHGKTLQRIALPVMFFFFRMAGASLNLDALRSCWPMANVHGCDSSNGDHGWFMAGGNH